jgi:hypothetical protein
VYLIPEDASQSEHTVYFKVQAEQANDHNEKQYNVGSKCADNSGFDFLFSPIH